MATNSKSVNKGYSVCSCSCSVKIHMAVPTTSYNDQTITQPKPKQKPTNKKWTSTATFKTYTQILEDNDEEELEGLLGNIIELAHDTTSSADELHYKLLEFRRVLKNKNNLEKLADVAGTMTAIANTMVDILSKYGCDETEQGMAVFREVIRIIALVPLDGNIKEKIDVLPISRVLLNAGSTSLKARKEAMHLITRLASEERLRADIGGTPGLIQGLLLLLQSDVCSHVTIAETIVALAKLCTLPQNIERARNAGAIEVLADLTSLQGCCTTASSSSLLLDTLLEADHVFDEEEDH